MPDSLRKFIGLLLLFAAVGVASCQALLVSSSSGAIAVSAINMLR